MQKKKSGSRKRLYFVWALDNNAYAVQELNEAFVPKAQPELITATRLKTGFTLEPGILAAPITTPDFRQIVKGMRENRAEPSELTDTTLAQLEIARKNKQVENDLRGSFNKALRALSRPRDRKGALIALEQLAETRNGITSAHKHMFRDFGVSLRKKSLPELALLCARRVLELAPNDDHAHFNIARILGILGYYDEADAHLRKAMQLDKKEKVYRKLQTYLQNLSAAKNE